MAATHFSGPLNVGGDEFAAHPVFVGSATTSGGSATETISVSGVLASDIVIATLDTEGASPVTLDAATTSEDDIDLTFSADPGDDHVVNYVVYRTA